MTVASPGAPTPPPGPPAVPPSHSKVPWIIGGVLVMAVIAALAFGVFGVQTLFSDTTVEEAGPTFDSGAAASAAANTAEEAPTVTTAATGTFAGVDHPGEGTVNLLTDGNQTFVRFEDDFATDNGPDLYAVVYLGEERIELGMLKGNQGSQNYELPTGIDPATVTTVAVWCKRFDATFTEATVA